MLLTRSMLLTRQAGQQSVSIQAVTLPIQTEHEGWDLEILHACRQKNFCATNKTNVHTAKTCHDASIACACP